MSQPRLRANPSASLASPVDYERYGRYDGATRLARARAKAGGDAAAIASLNGFKDRIRADGDFPPEAGRYHLYLAKGCPFCHRLTIGLALLGLQSVISVSLVDDARDARGWAFRETYGPDLVNGFTFLSEAYEATTPGFDGHIGVPVLWDKRSGRIVSTDSSDILADLASQFTDQADPPLDLYPQDRREEIDRLNQAMLPTVNFGVYLVGLAPTQAEYDSAVIRLFDMLDALDQRLRRQRFLVGDGITTSDIHLWVTLARFDIAYYPIFRANLKRLVDMPGLWRFARELYALPAFAGTTDFDAFKADYIRNFPQLTPTGIVPAGPINTWTTP